MLYLGDSVGDSVTQAHLRDVAKAILYNYDDATKMNWGESTTRLNGHFSQEYFLDITKEKITDMKMFTGEAPLMFSNRVRRNTLEAFSGIDEAVLRLFLQSMVFTNGLLDQAKARVFAAAVNQLCSVTTGCGAYVEVRTGGTTDENGKLVAKIGQALETHTSQPCA